MMGAAPADGGAGPRQTALRVVMLAVLVDYLGVGMMRTMMPFYAQRLSAACVLNGARAIQKSLKRRADRRRSAATAA